MLEEEKYKELKNKLKYLPHIRASNDFNDRLFLRIDELKSPAQKKLSLRKSVYSERIRDWIIFILRPAYTPAFSIVSVLLLIIIAYIWYSTLGKDENTLVFESTPVTEQSEFFIHKQKDQDISSSDISDKKTEVSNRNVITSDESYMRDGEIMKESSELKSERKDDFAPSPLPEEKMEKEHSKKPSEEIFQKIAPSIEKKEGTEESKDEKIMKKSDDVMLKRSKKDSNKVLDSVIGRGLQNQTIQADTVRAEQKSQEPDSTKH